MHYRRTLISRLRPSDRLAVTLLRGGESPNATLEMVDAFAALRRCAVDAGLMILMPGAEVVGASEFVILGWLAAWQRSRVEPAIEYWRIPISEILMCARLLDAAGFRVDYRHIVHVQGADSSNLAGAAGHRQNDLVPQAAPGMNWAYANPLRRRILSELADRGSMRTSELEQIGVSRQTISNMVKRGVIKRVRFGVYTISDRVAADRARLMKAE